jgi:hypothetical protein
MSEMEVSAIYLMEGCNDKLDRYNDRTTCEVLTLNETVETPATSTCLSVTCLDINTGHILLWRTNSCISNQSRVDEICFNMEIH